MSDFHYHFDLSRLVSALDEDLKAQMEFLTISPDQHTRVSQYLVSDLQSVRFNNLADDLAITDLWNPIRDNAPVVDLLLDLTSALQLHAESIQKNGWQELGMLVSEAMGCFNNDKVDTKHCALDNDDERDRYVDPATALKFIRSNPWLMTLFLMRRTTAVRKLINDVALRVSRGGPSSPPRDP
jgi:hypothetical protein